MNREYHKWYSPHLHKEMEFLVFGHAGAPVVFFPTRTARFYDYENWKIIRSLATKIDNGLLQVFCVDSNDAESFYCSCSHPSQRIQRHLHYEQYILHELLPFVRFKNANPFIISAGCSLGAYHAVNIAFRHPQLFRKVVGFSGRYDLTLKANCFNDLFDGYTDETVYYNMPSQYMPNLEDADILNDLKNLQVIFAVGKQDPFLANNKFLHNTLLRKGIHSELHIWEGEAHRSAYWRQIVPIYL